MSPFDELVEALKPFATIGTLLNERADDTRWLETPLFYCGTREDPHSHSLTGKAFDTARRALTRVSEGPDDETVERKPVWPLLHTMLVQFARRIAEADAAPTHDERVRKINAVSAHMAVKLEEYLDAPRAISALTKMEK